MKKSLFISALVAFVMMFCVNVNAQEKATGKAYKEYDIEDHVGTRYLRYYRISGEDDRHCSAQTYPGNEEFNLLTSCPEYRRRH